MNSPIKQEQINKAVWAACATFRGTVSAEIYKDYVLTLLFLKYISDVWQDHYEEYQKKHGDHPELIQELMKNERFILPKEASFYSLYERRHKAGNGKHRDQALHAIEEANITKLRDVFQDISFNSNRLGEEQLKHFDVVVANPPFSLEKWGHATTEKDRFGRFRGGLPPKTKGDYAFILHMIEVLKLQTGRMAVVAPHGVLFRGSSEGKIRQKLVEENLLDAVIGLPENLFYGTGIPAAILVFRKSKKDTNVLFIDASKEFKDGKNQNQLEDEHLAKVVRTYQVRQNVDKYAYLASRKEIAENDFNLNIPRYVDTFEEEEEIDLAAVRQEREVLKGQLAEIELKMDAYLAELGFEPVDKEGMG